MISYAESAYDTSHSTFKIKGLSTDEKPTTTFHGKGISTESTFFEKDTQQVYFYDGATDNWLPQP